MDNCCYNRPFDDQTQIRINLEAQAKLKIQSEIRDGRYQLVWSYVLDYENSKNPYEEKRNAISPWRDIASEYVDENEVLICRAEIYAEKGIKPFDALHISAAIDAGCEWFLTTDKKLLNTKIEGIKIISPIQFIIEMEESL